MMDYWCKASIKSTVVVPRSHKTVRGDSGSNKPNWVKWGGNSDLEKQLAADAQIINYTMKPNPNSKGNEAVPIDGSILCVAVFWDSLTVHGNGSTKKKYPKEGYLSKGEIIPPHFTLDKLDEALKFLDDEGYMVMDFNIKPDEWVHQVNLFREYMQEVNIDAIDIDFPTRPRLEKIKTQHLPSFKDKGLAQYYGSAHSRFMDAARNMECLQRVYREIFKFPTGYKSVQSCVIFRSAMARLGAMVSYIPNWMVTKEMKDILADGRIHGHSFTHDNDHINKVAVPKGIRPSPDPTKKAICAKSQKDPVLYMHRFVSLVEMDWGMPSFDCVSASVKGSTNTNWLHQDLDYHTLLMRIRMLTKHQRMSLTSEPQAKRKKISHDNNGNIPLPLLEQMEKETINEEPFDPFSGREVILESELSSVSSDEEEEEFTEEDSYNLIPLEERLTSNMSNWSYSTVCPGDEDEMCGWWRAIDVEKLKIFGHHDLDADVMDRIMEQRYSTYWGWGAYKDETKKLSWVKISKDEDIWCVIEKYDPTFE